MKKTKRFVQFICLWMMLSFLVACNDSPSGGSSNSSLSNSSGSPSSSSSSQGSSSSANSNFYYSNGLGYYVVGGTLQSIFTTSGEPLSGKIVIPSSVGGKSITAISEYSYIFRDKTLITEIVLPDAITFLPNGIFWGCTGLKKVTLPHHLSEIPEEAFHNCSSLSQIIIPNSVYSICNDAFYNCSSLKTVVLPHNIIGIGASSFFGCENLECVYLPKSLTLLSTIAFSNTRSLKAIYYEGTEEDWNKIETYWGKPSHFLTDKLVFNTPAPSYPRSQSSLSIFSPLSD